MRRIRPYELFPREEAQARGVRFYQGVRCKRGHAGRRYTKNGGCVECAAGYPPTDPEIARKASAAYAARKRAARLAANPPPPPPDVFQRIGAMLQGAARNRVKLRGLPVDPWLHLERKYVGDWLRRQPNCPCCGVKFDLTRASKQADASPSLDQLIPGLGYTTANARLICTRCNRLKSYAITGAELRGVADWMEREIYFERHRHQPVHLSDGPGGAALDRQAQA